MAYIRTMKNREGRLYVYMVEGYRENGKIKQRTLKSYGRLDLLEQNDPDILEKLKKEAENYNTDKSSQTISVDYSLNEEMHLPDKIYGWKLLDDIFRSLGLKNFLAQFDDKRSKSTLSDILRLLTFQRILNPSSKLATVESQNDLFGQWEHNKNSVYRALDKLDDIKNELQLHLHKKIMKLTNRSASLVFYDVTNYYFETDLNDEEIYDDEGNLVKKGLRRRGPSKEHRPKPIVQLGLFMDTNGIPISYRLFRGNQTDPITYLPAVEQVKKQFGLERIVVVADKAMNSATNVKETYKDGNGWLFSQKHRGKRGAPKDIQSFILEDDGWLSNPELTFAKKSMIRERMIDKGNKREGRQPIVVKEKVLVTWSKKYAERERIRRKGAIEYAEQLTLAEKFRQTAKKGGKKYLKLQSLNEETGEIKPFSPLISIDQESLDFDAQFDGVNVLVTSEVDMSDEEMLASYKELSVIEDCFRVTKTDFATRPVYVRTEEHIEGHFLTCFVSLILIRLLQYKTSWELSPQRICQALSSAKCTPLSKGYYRLQESLDMQKLNELCGIDWKRGIVGHEELDQYGKGWFHNKKNQ